MIQEADFRDLQKRMNTLWNKLMIPESSSVRGLDVSNIRGAVAVANVVSNETPFGVIDGVNDTFTVVALPNPATSLQLILSGVYQLQGVDYTLTGKTIVFTTPPPALSWMVAFYLK